MRILVLLVLFPVMCWGSTPRLIYIDTFASNGYSITPLSKLYNVLEEYQIELRQIKRLPEKTYKVISVYEYGREEQVVSHKAAVQILTQEIKYLEKKINYLNKKSVHGS